MVSKHEEFQEKEGLEGSFISLFSAKYKVVDRNINQKQTAS